MTRGSELVETRGRKLYDAPKTWIRPWRDQQFESISLQRGVCKLSVPRGQRFPRYNFQRANRSYRRDGRLELLSDLVPQVSAIVLLVNPNNANVEHVVRDEENAARAKGVQLTILKAATETEIDTAFATLVRSQTGLLVTPDSFFLSRREQLVALASHHAIPAIYPVREYAVEGGLISYGTSRTSVDRLLGIYAGKILKGAKPADLPVQQPTTFELVVNLKTAKELGLTIPPSILARADEVIE